MVQLNINSDHTQGVDLFFDDACSTPLQAGELPLESEARYERAALHRGTLAILTTFSLKVIKT